MSPGEVIAGLAIAITVLGMLVSGTWWASALFSNVKNNGKEGKRTYIAMCSLQSSIEDHVKECDKDRTELNDGNKLVDMRLEDHENRLSDQNERLIKIED